MQFFHHFAIEIAKIVQILIPEQSFSCRQRSTMQINATKYKKKILFNLQQFIINFNIINAQLILYLNVTIYFVLYIESIFYYSVYLAPFFVFRRLHFAHENLFEIESLNVKYIFCKYQSCKKHTDSYNSS